MKFRRFLSYQNAFVCCACALAFSTLTACTKLDEPSNPIQFDACADMPEARSSATIAVVGDKAYILGGRTMSSDYCRFHPQGYPTNIWQYNATDDTWSEVGVLPGRGRVNATAITIEDCIYFGLGFSGNTYTDTCYLTDWWQYNTATKTWKQLSDFPNKFTDNCLSYLVDGYIYVCYGFGTYGYSNSICKYDISNDKWEELPKNTKRMPAVIGAVGGQYEEHCFIGGGYSTDLLNSKLWYEFNPQTDGWTKRANLPQGRLYAASLANKSSIYLIGGRHWGGLDSDRALYDQILQYNISNNSWALCGHLPHGGHENMVAFKIGNTMYVGLGEDANGTITNKMYAWHD